MLKKIISFVLLLSIFTVQTFATTQSGIKDAFDELNYSLTVEWDQKDPDFYKEKMNNFYRSINDLRKQGMSNGELLGFAKSQLKNQKIAVDLDNMLQTIEIEKMSSEEASSYVMSTMKDSYQTGAAWRGGIGASIVLGLIIAIIVVAVIYGFKTYISPLRSEWNNAVKECEADPSCDINNFNSDDEYNNEDDMYSYARISA